MTRPTFHSQWLCVALLVSTRGTCARRRAGCVLTDARGHVLSTGYNGPAAGLVHCTDVPCAGRQFPSGQGLDQCEAIHAEQNALIRCRQCNEIAHVYCTVSPCVTCVKMLLGTDATHIWFHERYAHDTEARRLWETAGRSWNHLPQPDFLPF